MIELNGKQYDVKFVRVPEPVTFYVKGKLRQRNTMTTYCQLLAKEIRMTGWCSDVEGMALARDEPKPLASGRVTQSHKDVYNRRKATEAAFAAALEQLSPEDRAEAARQFFSPKPKPPKKETNIGAAL